MSIKVGDVVIIIRDKLPHWPHNLPLGSRAIVLEVILRPDRTFYVVQPERQDIHPSIGLKDDEVTLESSLTNLEKAIYGIEI